MTAVTLSELLDAGVHFGHQIAPLADAGGLVFPFFLLEREVRF